MLFSPTRAMCSIPWRLHVRVTPQADNTCRPNLFGGNKRARHNSSSHEFLRAHVLRCGRDSSASTMGCAPCLVLFNAQSRSDRPARSDNAISPLFFFLSQSLWCLWAVLHDTYPANINPPANINHSRLMKKCACEQMRWCCEQFTPCVRT